MTTPGGQKRKIAGRTLIIILVIVVALLGSGGYYFYTTSQSCNNCVTVNVTIIGGDTANSTDTYSPDSFTVAEGQHVTLVVLNTDDNTHALYIPAFNVNTGIIQSGNTARIQFVANQAGTFPFYEPAGDCQGGVGNECNSVQAMNGTLTVTG